MIKEMVNGFCMAMADSVPGVSGGTVAFIMGFYDQFIGSIHNLVFGKMAQKKKAMEYLAKLGGGWAIGMILAILALSALFESHIYMISSLFIGFILGGIPIIVKEEMDSFREVKKGILFGIMGIVIVVAISWFHGGAGTTAMDLSHFSIGLGVKLFGIGMIAISAMFLPGISGSTLLLIFGAYMPVISAIRGFLGLDLSYVPCLMFFGMGILAGAATVVKGIKVCMERFRAQSVYAILGMMIGSLYAIWQGPATLDPPQQVMTWSHFHMTACLCGVLFVIGLQLLKEKFSSLDRVNVK